MKAKWIALLVLLLLLTGSLYISVQGQAGVFVIENADAKVDLTVSNSPDLVSLINVVADRFIIEYANDLLQYRVQPIPDSLRVIINQVADRPIIEYANTNKYYTVVYPKAMIGDTTKPRPATVSARPSAGGTRLVFDLNEFCTLKLEYGPNPGAYTSTLNFNGYENHFEVLLSGLTPGATYYYRYTLVDRSGNSFVSSEGVLKPTSNLFIPLIKR